MPFSRFSIAAKRIARRTILEAEERLTYTPLVLKREKPISYLK